MPDDRRYNRNRNGLWVPPDQAKTKIPFGFCVVDSTGDSPTAVAQQSTQPAELDA